MRIVKPSSLVSMLFALLLISLAAKAQGELELPDSLPTTKEGFVKTEKDLVLIPGKVEAQTNDNFNKPSGRKKYHAKVTLMDGQKVKGILKLIGDDRIQLLERKIIGKVRTGVNQVPDTLQYRSIETIKIRNIGAGILGFVGGTVVGVIVGAVIGYLAPNAERYDYDDDLRVLTGFLGAGIGGVAGGIGGSKLGSRSFEIGGEYYNFQDFRLRMKKKGMEVE